MDGDPLRGNLFETMVVMGLYKTRLNQGRDSQLYYFRDSRGNKVDLIHKQGHMLTPIEIKSSQTFTKSFSKGLQYFKKLTKERCNAGYIIYGEMSLIPWSTISYLIITIHSR